MGEISRKLYIVKLKNKIKFKKKCQLALKKKKELMNHHLKAFLRGLND